MNLVTGATGIVGLRLVYDLLLREQPVRALKRSGSDMAFAERVLRFYGATDNQINQIEWTEGGPAPYSKVKTKNILNLKHPQS